MSDHPKDDCGSSPRHIRLGAPAKVNLYLEVVGRRADGYHELETIFQTIELADLVDVALVDGETGIHLSCDDPTLPDGHGNLAWRAAHAFLAGASGAAWHGQVRITLTKAIPHGAGLGGGSSDAAAVLRALARLLPHHHTRPSLARVALGLGSDVPFFLLGGTAVGSGRGEILTACPDLPALDLTVLMPAPALATPSVFAGLTVEERGPHQAHGAAWWSGQLSTIHSADGLAGLMANRLTASACRLCPEITSLLAWLRQAGIPALMSGSGSACLALGRVQPPPGIRAWATRLRPRSRLDSVSPSSDHPDILG